jgi:hypothetical protein
MDRFGRLFLGPLWDVYAPRVRLGVTREPVMEPGSAGASPLLV